MKFSDGDTCPHCGSDKGYTVSDYAAGWLEYSGYWNGEEERNAGEDGLRYRRSRTVRCDACGKRAERPFESPRRPL
jgi:hypothetical protein